MLSTDYSPYTATCAWRPFYLTITAFIYNTALPSSQLRPVQPAVQVHVLGAVHTPPFWQEGEQMAAAKKHTGRKGRP